MIDGYQRIRTLSTAEREALPEELRFAAVRDGIRRMIDHELSRASRDSARPYQDYRHFTARLEALADSRAERLILRALGQ